MSDGLNNEERVLAWLASWNPSFSGIAIVNPDFTFRSVNRQFCKIVGVTPAEIIGNSFKDMTPEPVKSLDVKNAELVKKGEIDSYLLPKTYELTSGKRVQIVLLVKGVYDPNTSEFLFYVSRIMENQEHLTAASLSQMPTGLLQWVDKKKIGIALTALIVALITAITNWLSK